MVEHCLSTKTVDDAVILRAVVIAIRDVFFVVVLSDGRAAILRTNTNAVLLRTCAPRPTAVAIPYG